MVDVSASAIILQAKIIDGTVNHSEHYRDALLHFFTTCNATPISDHSHKRRRLNDGSNGAPEIPETSDSITLARVSLDLYFPQLGSKGNGWTSFTEPLEVSLESLNQMSSPGEYSIALRAPRNPTFGINLPVVSNNLDDVAQHLFTAAKFSTTRNGKISSRRSGAVFTRCMLHPPLDTRDRFRLSAEIHWRVGLSVVDSLGPRTPLGHTELSILANYFPDTNMEEDTTWSVQDFYDNVRAPPTNAESPPQIQQCFSETELYPFQRRAVAWLLAREGVAFPLSGGILHAMERELQGDCPASFRPAKDADGRDCYVSHIQGQILTHFNLPWNPHRDLKGGILAEEMGLGKTVELLALICHHKMVPSSEKVIDPYTGSLVIPSHSTLIITPPSILEQWKSEIATHAPHLKVFHYQGLPAASAPQHAHDAATPENLLRYDIVLTTYHVLSREIHYAKPPPDRSMRHAKHYAPRKSPLVQIRWWRVCLDEAQMVESGVSQQATVARLIPRINAWAVSGTPLRKDIQDLRGLLVFLRYEPYSICKPIWDRLDKATFKEIFGQIAMRHTKEKIRNELTLPPQKRIVMRIPFSAIEEQNYSDMMRKMCEECGLSPDGTPSGKKDADNAFLVDKMREWLVRLRQTCLHLQVGRRNRKALNSRGGPLQTVDKVLDAMIDNEDASLKSEAKELIRAHLLCGHIKGNAGNNERRDEEALVEYRKALELVLLWIKRCRDELTKMKNQRPKPSTQGTGKKPDMNDEETDDDEDSYADSVRVSNIRKMLRTFLEVEHECRFFIADSYFRIKSNEKLTRPDSEDFHRFENLETEYYDQAKKIRSVLLKATKRKAIERKSKVHSQRELTAPRINFTSDEGGIETGKILESMENVCDLLDTQATLLDQWRKKVVDMALAPLVDEDEGMETTGDEYENSIKIQEELLVYTMALRTAIADRGFILHGLQDPLANQEFQAAVAQAGRAEGHAPHLVVQFAKAREELKLEDAGISLKGVMSAIRTLTADLQWKADSGDKRAKLELSMADNLLATAQKIFADQKVSLANFDKEQEMFRTAMNQRIEYYRQLQQLSDNVKRWREELDPTFCQAEFERSDKDRIKSQKKTEALEIKVKYLINMREKDHGAEEDDCAICAKTIKEAAMTPCGHVFGRPCLEKWIAHAGKCPVCRRAVRKNELIIHAPKKQVSELEEEVVVDGIPAQSPMPTADSTSIYGNISASTMSQINDIDLGGVSYGSKIDMIARHLLWIRHNDPGSKTVIFSQFGEFLDLLNEALSKWKIRCASMHSKHGISDFKSNPATEAFLLDAKTDSSGLNLVNATYVFLAEPMVNVALELQAIARVHRIGQRRPTTVFMYLVSGTVEEAIYDLSVSRRLEHIGKSRVSESGSVAPALQEFALETANSLELQATPLKQLLRKKGEGEVVPTNVLWKCLFGKRQRPAVVMEEVGREMRAAAVEERVAGLAIE